MPNPNVCNEISFFSSFPWATLKWKWAVEGPLIGGLRQNRTVSQHPVSFRWKMRPNEDASRPTVSPPTNNSEQPSTSTLSNRGKKNRRSRTPTFHCAELVILLSCRYTKSTSFVRFNSCINCLPLLWFLWLPWLHSQPTRGKLRKFNHHKNPLRATLIHKAEAEVNCRGVRGCEVVLTTRTHCRSVWTTAAPAGCAMAWRSSADAIFQVRYSIWKHFTVSVVRLLPRTLARIFVSSCHLKQMNKPFVIAYY